MLLRGVPVRDTTWTTGPLLCLKMGRESDPGLMNGLPPLLGKTGLLEEDRRASIIWLFCGTSGESSDAVRWSIVPGRRIGVEGGGSTISCADDRCKGCHGKFSSTVGDTSSSSCSKSACSVKILKYDTGGCVTSSTSSVTKSAFSRPIDRRSGANRSMMGVAPAVEPKSAFSLVNSRVASRLSGAAVLSREHSGFDEPDNISKVSRRSWWATVEMPWSSESETPVDGVSRNLETSPASSDSETSLLAISEEHVGTMTTCGVAKVMLDLWLEAFLAAVLLDL
mmetsp:Transcript_7543/g.27682  ORF Transcript_7543/g.27682 Transcript_7543/m.27682 type:complete len:281 (+) Transcript_7543:457-1299(+)